MTKGVKRFSAIFLCLLLALIGWFYMQLPDREVVGFIQDDGIYAITAKALAMGEGFKLIHVASAPMQVKYPILYPMLLSVGWLLNPAFPQNLSLLYGITLGCFLLGLAALLYYFWRAKQWPLWACFGIILLVAGNAQVMYYTTLLMSEGAYLLFSTLALLYAETQLKQPTWQKILIAVGLCTLAFHTRVLGFLIILAVTGSLWVQKWRRESMVFFSGATALTALPWLVWAFLNQPSSLEPITKTYGKYGVDFWVHSQTQYGQKLIQSLSNFIYGLLEFLFPSIARFLELPDVKVLLAGHPLLFLLCSIAITLCVYGLAGYFLLRMIQGLRKRLNPVGPVPFDISAWYVGLYCLLIVAWNFESQISRFLVVILPWIWFYLLEPLVVSLQRKQQKSWSRLLGICLIFILALATTPRLYTTLAYTRLAHQWLNLKKSPQYVNLWEDYRATFVYMQSQLPSKAIVAAGLFNGAIYLYTGRQTYPINLTALDRQQGLKVSGVNLWNDLKRHHVDYLLMEPEIGSASEVAYPTNMMARALLEFYPAHFKEVYSAPGGMLTLYQLTRL